MKINLTLVYFNGHVWYFRDVNFHFMTAGRLVPTGLEQQSQIGMVINWRDLIIVQLNKAKQINFILKDILVNTNTTRMYMYEPDKFSLGVLESTLGYIVPFSLLLPLIMITISY